eukprot:gnl/MRDRNA2_/MRDRNA2_29162_c0_seq1.p1 gnl/MRDRNA2_/MRDRNA2_29162_c0~~gnl/MRDRNA2_/MRDRNA2_29162_c0_seq1.p1  ORF type:complete len:267 (-),score=68.45 gnl/MRDRNA2_/MRDRNA2_29162_c0_seq1:241-1041(-)
MGFSKTTASFFSILGGPSKVEKLDMDVVDNIDAMERGFVGALALDKVKPEGEGRARKMIVERSEDRLCYVLYEDSEKVLEAKVTEQGVHVYASSCGSKTSAGVPAFTLTHDTDKTNWTIASSHCAKCAFRNPFNSCQSKGGQRIGFVRHGMEEIGEGKAMCMDVDIPQIGTDGQSEIWCALCDGPDEARIELSSLRPKWNEKLGSLCMDFKGRVEAASAKNFQLCLDEKPVLMYGKKNNGTFALEFEHPLSTAQAFTIALSTMYWT